MDKIISIKQRLEYLREVIKTLPIELNDVDGIDTVLLAQQIIKV